MAASAERAVQLAHDRETQLTAKLAESNAPYSEIASILQDYRVACEKAIFIDFDYAATQGVETALWGGHNKVGMNHRKRLQKLHRGGKDSAVEFRKAGKEFLDFIKSSQRFYRNFILELDSHFAGIPELRRAAQKWRQGGLQTPPQTIVTPALSRNILGSCHQTLIRLGDLSRWRESELGDQQRNWGPATGFYALAAEILPDSGVSFNQQAVIAVAEGNHFRTTYYLYRSLSTKEVHPQAKKNLELEFKKIATAWKKGSLLQSKQSRDTNGASSALTGWFVRLHSKCYRGERFSEYAELEKEVLAHLTSELKERSLEGTTLKIILINIAAEYSATLRLQADMSDNNQLSYFYFLRLNIKTFTVLLHLFTSELQRLTEGNDVTDRNSGGPKQLSDKISGVMRRILPALKLYSAWFICYWQIVCAKVTDMVSNTEVDQLWQSYALTLTLIAANFPADKLPVDQYMLEEDVDTIGFQPLTDTKTKSIWYRNGSLKPRFSDKSTERQHPNVEMLMRVRDFLVDGLQLVQDQTAPLKLDGLTFVYQDETPIQIIAAPPANAASASTQHNGAAEEPANMQAIKATITQPEKLVPVADNVAIGVSKDAAMEQMVDDLVGQDDAMDPLNDDDENLPPTPPEQTFDDTVLFDDTTYGLLPVQTDLGHNGQGGGFIGSPGTLYSASASRLTYSPTVRQFPPLPSLPDQSTIWNRSYGSPSPSSPYLAAESAHPLPNQGPKRHSRGPSLNSIRSSGPILDTSVPVTPLSAGGYGYGFHNAALGNGAGGWHLSATPTFAQQGFQPGAVDVSMMSPVLFAGSGPWASDLRSSNTYGRTPPNGQGG